MHTHSNLNVSRLAVPDLGGKQKKGAEAPFLMLSSSSVVLGR